MNFPSRSRIWAGTVPAILSLAVSVLQAAPEPAPLPVRSNWAALIPDRIQAGPQFGLARSRITSSSEYRSLVEPTPASRDGWIAPAFGALVTARWGRMFSLTLEPRRESRGLETREATVSFPDNPFPHTLKASTELVYTVWPLLLGLGWHGARGHVEAQIGRFGALLDHADIEWTVDGEPYRNMPQAEAKASYGGWMVGAGFGYRLGPGEILAGLEAEAASESIMAGMQGSIRSQSARMQMAYVWTLMGK